MPGFEGLIRNRIQKRMDDPATLHIFNAGADILSGTIDFIVIKFIPKNILAKRTAMCALSLLLINQRR
jgi:hypothetical protein